MKHLLVAIGRKLATLLPTTRMTREGLRQVSEPTLGAASNHLNESIDRAATHGHELLADGETRAHRVVDEMDKRLARQREALLDRTENACDRVSRRLIVRLLLAGFALLVAAGLVACAAFRWCLS